jgi:hypothetical protein
MTLASENPVIVATSFVDSASTSRITTTIRYDAGSRFSAARSRPFHPAVDQPLIR